MRMYDLILKKKRGLQLTKEEIEFFINGYVSGDIPDYQVSALMMAICFQGMTDEETTDLTLAMMHSGDIVDLSNIHGFKVDKHSTGGVGDKTSLIVGPIVAACGVKVAKMSGRGLGHTGGTLDKLESIEGFQINLSREDFTKTVNEAGFSIIGQSGNLVPADKKLYALRDVTATVDSLPLIASSIMSKKLASGSDGIVLDVKTGSGAFMKTLEDSISLAEKMVDIGKRAGKEMAALVTDMDIPLGYAIGNSLEVKEAVLTLKGEGPKDLLDVCLSLAANMLALAKKGTVSECMIMAKNAINDGSALRKLLQMVKMQGGNVSLIEDTTLFPAARFERVLTAKSSGYVYKMDTEACGIAASMLHAGRRKKEDIIDYAAGIMLKKKTGDYVNEGDVLAVLYAENEEYFADAIETLCGAYTICEEAPKAHPYIYKTITK